MRRSVLVLAAIAATAGTSSAAAVEPAPGARIFPFAGTGTTDPVDGMQAGTAELNAVDVAALPDGSTLLMLNAGGSPIYTLEEIAVDGTERAVPTPGISLTVPDNSDNAPSMALQPDGRLVLSDGRNGLFWLDLATGAMTSEQVGKSAAELVDVTALADGTDVVADASTVVRVDPATGAVTTVFEGKRNATGINGLAALSGGAFAVSEGRGDEHGTVDVFRVGDGGAPKRVGSTDDAGALVGRPDGSVLAYDDYDGSLTRFRPGARPQLLTSAHDGADTVGSGDGGPLAHAVLPDGVEALSFDASGDLFIASRYGLEVVPMEPTTLPLAALARPGYAALRTGDATLTTTTAGVARVTLKRRGKAAQQSTPQAVPAGGGTVPLGFVPRPGVYDVTVTFTDTTTGRVVVSQTTADTHTTLTTAAAKKAIDTLLENTQIGDDDDSSFAKRGPCRRHGSLRYVCARLDHDGGKPVCHGRVIATLRPDGLRLDDVKGTCKP